MSQAEAENSTVLPVTRRQVEAQIDVLIDLLDTLDPDPDLEPDLAGYSTGMDSREGDDPDLEDGADSEPSLGWQGPSGWLGESTNQSTPDFCANADTGRDLEDEHCGAEPDIEEGSLGWPEVVCQDGANWNGGYHGDKEDEHDGREPDVDAEPSLGWTDNPNQASAAWQANHLGAADLEDGVGAVRKPRPASKTGRRIMVGAEVFR